MLRSGRLEALRTAAKANANRLPDWWLLYFVSVLGATLTPLRPGIAPPLPWTFDTSWADLIVNAFLFVPWGMVLARFRPGWVLLSAAVTSCSLEILQTFLLRHPGILDVLMNTTGAGLGLLLARRTAPAAWRLQRSAVRAAAALMAILIVVSLPARPSFSPDDWEPFPLVLGNEPDGGYPWTGWIQEADLYDRPLLLPGPAGPAESPWSQGGPILRLCGPPRSSLSLDGPEGNVQIPSTFQTEGDSGLFLSGDPKFLPEAAALHALSRVRESGAFSLEVLLRPRTLDQSGPARIVSFSRDGSARNFTLGQEGKDLALRVRSPGTGPNGLPPSVETRGGALTGEFQRVRAVYDGFTAFLFVDGRCLAQVPISLQNAPWPLGSALGMTLMASVAFGGLMGASLVRTRRPGARTGALLVAGVAIWIVLRAVGLWEHVAGFDAHALVLGGAALLAAIPVQRAWTEPASDPLAQAR